MNFELTRGDTLAETKKLENQSVDCVITSPPYWQLRDYGFTEQWGLEPTFELYLEKLWLLMDELHRVLKPTGTAWINLGDSYHNATKWTNKSECPQTISNGNNRNLVTGRQENQGLPEKCLIMIPHRFAIGCIERGWILRNDIVWAKRNGMPESVRDRFSKKHEYFFFFAKQSKYFFDLDAIRDEVKTDSIKRTLRGNSGRAKYATNAAYPSGVHAPTMSKARENIGYGSLDEKIQNCPGKNPGDVSDFWDVPTKGSKNKHYATYNTTLVDKPIKAGCPKGGVILDPFCGTATTGVRALELGRNFIGIDGKQDYIDIAALNLARTIENL